MVSDFSTTRGGDERAAARRRSYGFFSPRMTASVLCFPPAVLAAVGLWFALSFEVVCYPRVLKMWPELRAVFSPYSVPPLLVALAAFCGLCSALTLAASLVGLLFRRGWAIWTLRKGYVLLYVLFAFYAYVAWTVIGRAAGAADPPLGELELFAWRWQSLWPAGCLALLTALLHVLSWRRGALILYTRCDDETPAAGDQIIENIRTGGRDPDFRRSVLGSSLAHLLVIVIIPFILSRWGCIRPYRVPLGSGRPAVAMMKVVQPKKKKKKRKKYILSVNSPIIFELPDLDKDSDLVKDVEEATSLTYQADTNAAHGAMGTGGGNTPGWADGFADGQVRFIRLEYNGPDWDDGMDPATRADTNFLEKFRDLAGGINVARQGESHPISHLRKYPKGQAPPFVYMTGSNNISVPKGDVKALREYLCGGGMLLADCGSPNWDRNFRGFISSVFPGNPLREISDDDPIFQIPFTFPNGPPPLWHHGGNKAMGVKYKGRWAVFYFPGDLNDAWKSGHSGLAPDLAEGAFHLGTNVVYYSFTQYLRATRKYRK